VDGIIASIGADRATELYWFIAKRALLASRDSLVKSTITDLRMGAVTVKKVFLIIMVLATTATAGPVMYALLRYWLYLL